jgi:hypothetical protein
MSTQDEPGNEREQEVNRVIAAYLEAVRLGQAPDREEVLHQHPHLAEELRSFFADRDRLTCMGEALAASPALGTKVCYFGDYELLEKLGEGGMGVVFRARQLSLKRTVALKMILGGELASSDKLQRFRREAEAVANLDHPNIVPIYEVGEHGGQHCFSMKLIEGGTLSSACSVPGSATPQAAQRGVAQLLATIARAVHYAHQRGILHRDLKPGNILLDREGQPQVTDFGLARKVESDSRLTQSGAIVGTPSYMAPEQAVGRKDLSVAVDVYSLGAILFEMLTGRASFRAETPLDTLSQVVEKDPEPPRSLNPHLDPDLETICLKCLRKEPEQRYESAAALADDLERWLRHEPIQARPSTLWERAVKWLRRQRAVAGAWGVSVLVSLAAVASAYGVSKVAVLLALGSLWLAIFLYVLGQLARRTEAEGEPREDRGVFNFTFDGTLLCVTWGLAWSAPVLTDEEGPGIALAFLFLFVLGFLGKRVSLAIYWRQLPEQDRAGVPDIKGLWKQYLDQQRQGKNLFGAKLSLQGELTVLLKSWAVIGLMFACAFPWGLGDKVWVFCSLFLPGILVGVLFSLVTRIALVNQAILGGVIYWCLLEWWIPPHLQGERALGTLVDGTNLLAALVGPSIGALYGAVNFGLSRSHSFGMAIVTLWTAATAALVVHYPWENLGPLQGALWIGLGVLGVLGPLALRIQLEAEKAVGRQLLPIVPLLLCILLWVESDNPARWFLIVTYGVCLVVIWDELRKVRWAWWLRSCAWMAFLTLALLGIGGVALGGALLMDLLRDQLGTGKQLLLAQAVAAALAGVLGEFVILRGPTVNSENTLVPLSRHQWIGLLLLLGVCLVTIPWLCLR